MTPPGRPTPTTGTLESASGSADNGVAINTPEDSSVTSRNLADLILAQLPSINAQLEVTQFRSCGFYPPRPTVVLIRSHGTSLWFALGDYPGLLPALQPVPAQARPVHPRPR